jgi:NAD(P)-dependent dehydrogenase (short-subunit alcohol dehydrogenase family)
MEVHELEGKVAIVTGAARGIGYAIAEKFLTEGASVLLADINDEACGRAVEHLELKLRNRARTCRIDMGKHKSIHSTVDSCIDHFGRIDILVNNAGIVERGKIETITLESWNRVLKVNLTGTLLCSKAVIPHMKSMNGGVILNVSSVSATLPDVDLSAYCVSKAGIEILTKVMSAELAPYGIRVNAYSPGVTQTPMTRNIIENRREEKLQHISLRRFGTPEDIAELALFLCTARAAFITGAIIRIDGGTMVVENPWKAWAGLNKEDVNA